MTNRKTTRRALVLSMLSLLLCVSMLVGTTFAWFTDSVTSGKNQIIAGNLDIELYYQNDEITTWTPVGENSNVFKENTLWEPGHTEVVKLKVVNEGTLALKYQLGVNVAGETGSINVDGKEFKLSDYIKFAVINGDQTYNREQAVAAAEAADATALKDAYNSGILSLAAKEEKIVTLVVYMPTSVGNEANYKTGAAVPTIQLGIKLFATQVEAEYDSFGNDYDKNAWNDGFKVTTAEELQDAIDAGETEISVAADITTDKPIVIPEGATVTLNLNGKKISAAFKDAGNGVIVNEGKLTLVGGTVENTAVNGDATIYNAGDLTLEDVQVVGAPIGGASGYPTYCIRSSGDLTVEEGTEVFADRGCLFLSGTGTTTINGGTFTNNDIEPRLNGRSFTSHVVVVGNGANNKLTINDGTFQHKHTSTSGGVVINNWSAVTVDIAGGNFSGGNYYGKWDNLSDYGYGSTKTPFSVTGGTFTGMDKNYVAAGYKAVQTGDVWMVVADSTNYVTTSEEFVTAINVAADGSTILVAAGSYEVKFTNNTAFNVDNLTIQGLGDVKLDIASTEVHYGRIQGDDVTFENIHFTDATVGATGKATYNNCTFDGRLEMASSGGKETYANGCTMKNVHTSGDMGAGNGYFTDCTMELAEYGNTSHNPKLTFTDCTIGTLKPWNVNTELVNTTVETMDLSDVTSAIVKIDGVAVVQTNDALKAAIDGGNTKVLLLDGEYDINGIQKNGLTLVGMGTNVKVANTTKYAGGKAEGAIWQPINLENVTITNTVYTMADGGDSTFKNVYFAAGFRQGYGKGVVFEGCTFGSNSEGYALHFQTDSASEGGNITLKECKFEGGKVHLGGKRAYTFTGCEFASGTDFQVWSTVTLDGCTVNGETVTAANAATLFPNLDMSKVTLK